MATPKTGLTVAIKFTPQAQADEMVLHEDQLNDGTQSLTNAADATQNILANDGGGAGTQVMAVIAGNAVDAVKGDLARYVDLANFSGPKAGYSSATLGDGHVDIVNGQVIYNTTHDYTALAEGEVATIGTFTYIIRMGNGAFSVTTATIKVMGDNDGPVATADATGGSEDSLIVGSVAANDFDPDHGETASLAYQLNTPVDGLSFNSNGTYSFDAGHASYQHLAEGATAIVTTTYTVTDVHGASATSTLTITVTGTNDKPVAEAATNAGAEDGVIAGSVHATDVDDGAVLSFSSETAPGFTMNADGTYTLDAGDAAYQHLAEGATADVVVTYTATDEHGASSQSTVTIELTGVNDGPVAQADTAAAMEDTIIAGSVAGNDSDVDDGAVLTWTLDDAVAGLVLNEDGSFTFDAGDAAYQALNAGDVLPVVAHYTVTDEHGAAGQSTLTISVSGVNEAPPPAPPAPEPTQHQGTFNWTVTGHADPYSGSYALEGTNWSNFQISVDGTGDFDWKKEGFDITGDVTGGYRGPNDHNSVINAGAEPNTTYSAGNISVTLDTSGLADGHLDYDVALTNQTNDNSQVNFTFTYDYLA